MKTTCSALRLRFPSAKTKKAESSINRAVLTRAQLARGGRTPLPVSNVRFRSSVKSTAVRNGLSPDRIGRDHRMHVAKLRCITLTTRRERTLRTSQITMTTRLGLQRGGFMDRNKMTSDGPVARKHVGTSGRGVHARRRKWTSWIGGGCPRKKDPCDTPLGRGAVAAA